MFAVCSWALPLQAAGAVDLRVVPQKGCAAVEAGALCAWWLFDVHVYGHGAVVIGFVSGAVKGGVRQFRQVRSAVQCSAHD